MDAAYPSTKDPIARLFDVTGGVLSHPVGLDKQRRLTWPSESNRWLNQFRKKNFLLLHAGVKCLILMSRADHIFSYLALVDQMPDQSLVQRANALATFLMKFRGPCPNDSKVYHRIRATLPVEAVVEAFGEKTVVSLTLIIKRRWAELWEPAELDTWRHRLETHCQPGVPLTPPPFTPDVVRAYVRAYQEPFGGMRRAA